MRFFSLSSTLLFLGAVLICLFTFPERSLGQEGEVAEEEPPVEKTCQKWMFDLVGLLFEALGPCLMGGWQITGPKQVVSKFFCLVKCILIELALLDDEGKLDQVSAAVFFGENFPKSLRDIIVAKADPCFKMAETFDGKEQYCKSYADFAQCAGGVVANAMIPYVMECFGSPFVTFGVNMAFNILKGMVPSGRSGRSFSDFQKERNVLGYKNFTDGYYYGGNFTK